VAEDIDELISSLDCPPEKPKVVKKVTVKRVLAQEQPEAMSSPGVPEGADDPGAVPWLDRYETTNNLIGQLEETLRVMEAKGVNLTSAWELANTARSLLESADVPQALIYANRSFRLAMDVHRFPDSTGAAAS
jgi:hypothetical protein